MKRSDSQRLSDVLVAIDVIERHLQRGALSDPLIFDAVRVRLIKIGEAISHIDVRLLRQSPDIAWREFKNMRNHLAHNYFGTDELIIAEVVDQQLVPLAKAVNRLLNGKPSSSV